MTGTTKHAAQSRHEDHKWLSKSHILWKKKLPHTTTNQTLTPLFKHSAPEMNKKIQSSTHTKDVTLTVCFCEQLLWVFVFRYEGFDGLPGRRLHKELLPLSIIILECFEGCLHSFCCRPCSSCELHFFCRPLSGLWRRTGCCWCLHAPAMGRLLCWYRSCWQGLIRRMYARLFLMCSAS